jgi:hypothetical protein
MLKSVLYMLLSSISVVIVVMVVRIRDGVDAGMIMSRNSELLNATAIVEKPALVAQITKKPGDWTSVPSFLYGDRNPVDLGIVLAMLPSVIIFLLALLDFCQRTKRDASR